MQVVSYSTLLWEVQQIRVVCFAIFVEKKVNVSKQSGTDHAHCRLAFLWVGGVLLFLFSSS